jgi:DNA-binding MarR family transcriptional regulator
MGRGTRMQSKEVTLLESALRLQGEFRRSLEPIQVTPLQAAMILFLRRHEDGRVSDLAIVFCLKLPTVVQVVNVLERRRWVGRRTSEKDGRAVCLRLSRQGQTLARKIEAQIRNVRGDLTTTEEV